MDIKERIKAIERLLRIERNPSLIKKFKADLHRLRKQQKEKKDA